MLAQTTVRDLQTAHWTGGLVARAYAHEFGERRLHKIIYIGTPHRGAPKSFGPLAFEKDSLVNNFLRLPTLSSPTLAEVSRTFPAAFQLLPRDPFIYLPSERDWLGIDVCYLEQSEGGFLVSSRWVSIADRFHENINVPLSVRQFQIVGSAVPTIKSLVHFTQPRSNWGAVAGNGDGSVPIESANAVLGESVRTFHCPVSKKTAAKKIYFQTARFAPVLDGFSQPLILFPGQGHTDGLAANLSCPLKAWTAGTRSSVTFPRGERFTLQY